MPDGSSQDDNETIIELATDALRGADTTGADDADLDTRARKILCLLFDDSKRPGYQTAMAQVRASYAGIADDAVVQQEFRNAVGALATQGRLNSLAVAMDSEIWRDLQRPVQEGEPLNA